MVKRKFGKSIITMKAKLLRSFLVLLLPVIFNSCATITKDDSQPVAFSSDPQLRAEFVYCTSALRI